MSPTLDVALLGFSEFERLALNAYLRLTQRRPIAYATVDQPAQAELLVVDADQAELVKQVVAMGREGRAVFVGAHAPGHARAWMMRPIDPLHLLRELDVLSAAAFGATPPVARTAQPETVADVEPAARGETVLAPPEPPQQRRPAAPQAEPRPPRAPAIPDIDALLVDEDPAALRAAEKALGELGLSTVSAGGMRKALEALARHTFKIVFLDIGLQSVNNLDCLGLCQRIKRSQIHLGETPPSVVLVAARVNPLERVRGELAGCDGYLGKPLPSKALHRALNSAGLALPATAR